MVKLHWGLKNLRTAEKSHLQILHGVKKWVLVGVWLGTYSVACPWENLWSYHLQVLMPTNWRKCYPQNINSSPIQFQKLPNHIKIFLGYDYATFQYDIKFKILQCFEKSINSGVQEMHFGMETGMVVTSFMLKLHGWKPFMSFFLNMSAILTFKMTAIFIYHIRVM